VLESAGSITGHGDSSGIGPFVHVKGRDVITTRSALFEAIYESFVHSHWADWQYKRQLLAATGGVFDLVSNCVAHGAVHLGDVANGPGRKLFMPEPGWAKELR
jgi:hypothetical protein